VERADQVRLAPGGRGVDLKDAANTVGAFTPNWATLKSEDIWYYNLGFRVASIPEPSTGLLVLTGLLGFAARRRWRVAP
jgi:hypothetical protein